MKILSIIFLLVGLVLCPGYLVYGTMFSGSEIGEFQFVDRDVSSFSFGVFRARSTGDDHAKKESGIRLSPDMNPIRLIVKTSYLRNNTRMHSRRRSSDFELSFYKSSDLLWTEPFQISDSRSDDRDQRKTTVARSKTSSQAIKLLTVKEDANYKLRLKQLSRQDLPISDLSVEVRANVMEIDTKVWGTGAGLVLLSLFGFYLASRKSSESPV